MRLIVMPSFLVSLVTVTFVYLIWSGLDRGIGRFLVVGTVSTILLVGQIFLFVLSKEEKNIIYKMIKRKC